MFVEGHKEDSSDILDAFDANTFSSKIGKNAKMLELEDEKREEIRERIVRRIQALDIMAMIDNTANDQKDTDSEEESSTAQALASQMEALAEEETEPQHLESWNPQDTVITETDAIMRIRALQAENESLLKTFRLNQQPLFSEINK